MGRHLFIAVGLAVVSTATATDFPIDLSTVTGTAVVREAGLLEINGVRIRLEGIEALAPADRCLGEPEWRCGEYARDLLAAYVRDQRVRCRLGEREGDTWRANCAVNRIDLQAFLVSRGLAKPAGRAGGLYTDLAKRAEEMRGPIYTRAPANAPAQEVRDDAV